MKNNLNIKMVKKFLVLILLVLSLASVSAFCTTQGYLLDESGNSINATKVNIVCKRLEGDLTSQVLGNIGYGFPFGNWYDDCSYCDLGVKVIAFEENSNFYGEVYNETCNSEEIELCHTDIYLEQVVEKISSKETYDLVPDVGPLAEDPKPMPKSNESPETKIKGIKPESNYTSYYLGIGIIGIILIIIALKYGKK